MNGATNWLQKLGANLPFHRERYPKEWPAISKRIRERSGGKCECSGECGIEHNRRCNAPNGKWIWRGARQWWDWHEFYDGEETPRRKVIGEAWGGEEIWAVKVVLTVAHLNHVESDVRDENLLAMCQACHLRYDGEHHKKNAAATRRRKKVKAGQLELTEP